MWAVLHVVVRYCEAVQFSYSRIRYHCRGWINCTVQMAATKGKALIILAEGAEEMEAVITADVLRRGKVRVSPCL